MTNDINYKPDFSKTGKEMLVDLINWANRNTLIKPLNAGEVYFSHPLSLPSNSDCNTSITIDNAVWYRGFEHPTKIQYNRLDLTLLARSLHFSFDIEVEDTNRYTTARNLIPLINQTLNIHLEENDIKYELLDNADKNGCIQVVMKVADNSIAFTGELRFKLSPKPIRLDTGIVNTKFTKSFRPPNVYGLG